MSIRAMGQATVTMQQLQMQMDMVAHNLANSQTTGYKQSQTEFQSILFQHITNQSDPENARGRVTPDGIRVGTGAKLGAINNDLSIGAMKTTDRGLDTMLLNKNHFYNIQVQENGEAVVRYTRDGSFYLSPMNNGTEMMLVTVDGNPVLGENGTIRFGANFDSIDIRENGAVVLTYGNQSQTVGQLAISNAIRPRVLESTGDNFYKMPDLEALGYTFDEIIEAVPAAGNILRSGVLEMSNVSMQDQMVQLIGAQRSYQLNARTITMADQMQGLINQIR